VAYPYGYLLVWQRVPKTRPDWHKFVLSIAGITVFLDACFLVYMSKWKG